MEARSLDPIEAHPTDTSSPLAQTADAGGRRWPALAFFALLAIAITISDQLFKSWIVSQPDRFHENVPYPVIGDWLRIDLIHNAGGLFGLFQGSAVFFGFVTIAVVVVLVAIEIGSGWRSWLVTITLSLLLGGAIGNFIDRYNQKYVTDFVDIGIGTYRFYIFNLADSAVTLAVILMFVLWFVAPHLGVQMPAEVDGGSAKMDQDAGSVTTSTKDR
ncbi:MAG TPA: signal peptidase II [Candidatus Limnocylindrales bacterium]